MTYKQEVRTRAASVRERGFTMVETLMVVLVAAVMAAFAIPTLHSVVYQYRLHSAVTSVSYAIQTARYEALDAGYPYQLTLTGTSSGGGSPVYWSPTYQFANEVTGTSTFATVGNSVPITGSAVSLSTPTTLQFSPNGSVTATTGSLSFNLVYNGSTETITVTNYGRISVSP
jgi:prepilin-type N-terminal cleavage/methylation domain-containing protein